jgi:hypothetical protein
MGSPRRLQVNGPAWPRVSQCGSASRCKRDSIRGRHSIISDVDNGMAELCAPPTPIVDWGSMECVGPGCGTQAVDIQILHKTWVECQSDGVSAAHVEILLTCPGVVTWGVTMKLHVGVELIVSVNCYVQRGRSPTVGHLRIVLWLSHHCRNGGVCWILIADIDVFHVAWRNCGGDHRQSVNCPAYQILVYILLWWDIRKLYDCWSWSAIISYLKDICSSLWKPCRSIIVADDFNREA